MTASLVGHFRAMARNNLWSNDRLLRACRQLDAAAFAARRTSFFPSLRATLNHILLIDRYYLEGLEGGLPTYAIFADDEPFTDPAELHLAQAVEDRRLIALCDALGPSDLDRPVHLDRGPAGIHAETVGTVLPHLFVHQIHHRGQAHAMLAGTAVAPPQLDEFFLMNDLSRRGTELAMLNI
jgi:uncharacterized damage-inducible protein DinB